MNVNANIVLVALSHVFEGVFHANHHLFRSLLFLA